MVMGHDRHHRRPDQVENGEIARDDIEIRPKTFEVLKLLAEDRP
jgi:hypothetical protein